MTAHTSVDERRRIVELHSLRRYSQREIGEIVGRSRQAVQRALRFASAPEPVSKPRPGVNRHPRNAKLPAGHVDPPVLYLSDRVRMLSEFGYRLWWATMPERCVECKGRLILEPPMEAWSDRGCLLCIACGRRPAEWEAR